MSQFHGAQLEGGPYDGDRGDLGYWPEAIWAFTVEPGNPESEIGWTPDDLTSSQVAELQRAGHGPEQYIRDHERGGVMIYTWERIQNGPYLEEEELVGAGARNGMTPTTVHYDEIEAS